MSPSLLAADPLRVEAADLFVLLGRRFHERDGSLFIPDDQVTVGAENRPLARDRGACPRFLARLELETEELPAVGLRVHVVADQHQGSRMHRGLAAVDLFGLEFPAAFRDLEAVIADSITGGHK